MQLRLGLGLQRFAAPLGAGGGEPEPEPGAGSLFMAETSDGGENFTFYPVDASTGIGTALGTYAALTDTHFLAHFPFRMGAEPGYVYFPAMTPSGGGLAAFDAATGAKSGATLIINAAGVDPATAVAPDGNIFLLSMDSASDTGEYVARMAQMVGGTLTAVGNALDSTFGHDTGFSAGIGSGGPNFAAQVIDGHFCLMVPDSSTGRGNGQHLYAFSFDGTDLTVADSLDLNTTSWVIRAKGPGYFILGDDFGAPNLKFVTYTAAGGFVDEFTIELASILGPTDLLNSFTFDPVAGRIHIGVSDDPYENFWMVVAEPNFGTGTLDIIATVTPLPEADIYPTVVTDNVVVLGGPDFDPGIQITTFDGSAYNAAGALNVSLSPYDVTLTYVPGE